VNDATNAFQGAINAGDIHVTTPGTYKILGRVNYLSNRHIQCGDGSYATGKAGTYAFVANSTGNVDPFYVGAGITNWSMAGCQIRGAYYNNPPGACNNNSQQFFYLNAAGSGLLMNNDFNGVSGYNAAILFDGHASYGHSNNIIVTDNMAETCGLRFVELDDGINVTVSYNDLTDCPIEGEVQATDQSVTGWLITHNITNWHFGTAQGNVCFANSPSWNSHGCGAANHLAAGLTQDYSGCTYSFNTNQGFGGSSNISNWQYENNVIGIKPGVYISNTCVGGCSIKNPPGSTGSNQ